MDPHSSASKCPKVIHRSRSTEMILAAAEVMSGNNERSPVWNSNGSSASTMNWLNMKSASAMYVESR